jgi:tripartite-type tricarboxylate transporter receptor subunit TctC
LRALAVTSAQRVAALPEVPTLAESAVPGFDSISWIGLLAPAGTPREIVEKISADVREVIAADDVRNRLIELGAIPAANTPAQFAALIEKDRARYAKIIAERGITID